MNYYPHHIGDFNNSTRHLTRVERSVYRDAIELYYDTEQPLDIDIERLARRLLCRSDEEKTALANVLSEFFIKKDNGFFHARCDDEIEKYRLNTTAKAKAGRISAEKRKAKKACVEHVLNTRTTDEQLTKNQEPRTKNQEPSINIYVEQAQHCLEYLNQVTGRKFTKSPELNARLKDYTVDEVKQVIEHKAAEWMNNPKMQQYLRPQTLFNANKFEGYLNDSKQGIKHENTNTANDFTSYERGSIAARALDLLDY